MGAEESTLNCCARQRGGGHDIDEWEEQPTNYKRLSTVREEIAKTVLNDVAAEGYLNKLDQRGAQKPRYFRLRKHLFYFGTNQELVAKGVVWLEPDEKLPIVSPCLTIAPHAIEIRHSCVFFFRASSPEITLEWKNIIDQAMVDTSETDTHQHTKDFENGNGDANGHTNGESNGESNGHSNGVTTLSPILKEDFLEHKGFGDWKRYWVVVHNGVLLYYSNVQDSHPKGRIELHRSPHPTEVSVCPINPTLLRVCYCRTLHIIAESTEQQHNWMTQIETAISEIAIEKTTAKKNVLGWKRSGKIREVITPFFDFMRDPLRTKYFQGFVKEMGCEAYMLFWLDVQQFKRLCKKEEPTYLKPFATKVYGKYLTVDGTFFVGLPLDVCGRTQERIEQVNPTAFDEPQEIVYQILHRDYYHHFLTSEHCEAMVNALFSH
eukprot:c2219_g1_i1.p1 GENE.c2219_g1_i1~~c2219_g1_i1.p1  ORF type:complete len:434 (-),score=101.01 c2219_g1_i1:90-1391(-)